jgi:hypothetical protein
LTRVRNVMKKDLLAAADATGDKSYAEVMKAYSDKMDAIDDAKKVFGKDPKTREFNAESVISNIFNKNKTQQQKALKRLGDIFGEGFYEMAKNASLAKQLGEEGKATLFPTHTTGRAGLPAQLATVAGSVSAPPLALLASPLLSTRMTLPAMNAIQRSAPAIGRLGGGMTGASAAMSPYMSLKDLQNRNKNRR